MNKNMGDGLSEEALEFFKKELIEKREKLISALERESCKDERSQIRDEADMASFALNSHLSNVVTKKQIKLLKGIEKSLKQIDEGTYGVCHLCDEPIHIERLKVKIFAKYCISCREIIEKETHSV